MKVSPVHARRLTAQLLAGRPARDPVTVAQRLLAIQGQDPRAARLAIRARTRGVSAADVDHALTEDRSLLITWLNRGTLHLVRSEDYPWLALLTTPQLRTANSTRLAQEGGVTPTVTQRGLKVIERALASDGPLTRAQIGHALESADVPIAGQGIIHLLIRAAIDGLVIRGPMIGHRHAYVLVRDWLPVPGPIDRDAALAELARRYLVGHEPASDRDLARWAGVPLRDARAGLSAIARELRERPDGLVELESGVRSAPLPTPRLLGAFEPVLLGWTSREDVLGEHAGKVVTGGIFRGFAMSEGRAVAVWAIRGGRVMIEPYMALPDEVGAALQRDAEAVLAFLGM